jgi:hypothetical protein
VLPFSFTSLIEMGYFLVIDVSPDDLWVTGLDAGLIFLFGKYKGWLKDIFLK